MSTGETTSAGLWLVVDDRRQSFDYLVTVCACHIEIKGYLLTYLLYFVDSAKQGGEFMAASRRVRFAEHRYKPRSTCCDLRAAAAAQSRTQGN